MSDSKFFFYSIDGDTPVSCHQPFSKDQRHSWLQVSVNTIGALTTDPDTQGTTHGEQSGTSCALPWGWQCLYVSDCDEG
ncbi:hypothetical protein TNCV_1711281 [Trichonephila clavipes]|nr:hypothetical protein TNCV_1711281 [Trichonephila clavipes]